MLKYIKIIIYIVLELYKYKFAKISKMYKCEHVKMYVEARQLQVGTKKDLMIKNAKKCLLLKKFLKKLISL